ncbi:MAG: hypothetical protein JF597_45430 [Streptomyces sp.]|nr:hypothetical protein [Streptomyces sp.]
MLTGRLGTDARVGQDLDGWDEPPARVTAGGRALRIDSSAVGDDSALVTRGGPGHFSLFVIPTDAPLLSARAAMPAAVRTDNLWQAGQILLGTGGGRVRPAGSAVAAAGAGPPTDRRGNRAAGLSHGTIRAPELP